MKMPIGPKEKSAPSKNQLKKTANQEKKEVKKIRRKSKKDKIVKLDSLKQIKLDAAGLDIGSSEIFACVPEGREEKNVRVFKTFTADLNELANWLINDCNINTVAMESTGVYWIPIYEILESRGVEVNLINARRIKNVPGKKTDILDCQWIQQLHSYGLLTASFRPEEDMCELRGFIRHREMLVKYRSFHIQHIQKNIEIMNIKLCNVISDITGVTGMQIIRAILGGERDPVKLAQFRNQRCSSTEEEISKSLEGNYKPEYMFALRQAVDLYDYYSEMISKCDREIEKKYSTIKIKKEDSDLPPLPKKRKSTNKNRPDFDLRTHLYQVCGVDLTMIDGLDSLTVQTVISEIGLDMGRWKTVKHFTSWLGLCPCNKITGGKVIGKGSKKVDNRASLALRVAARSLHHSNSAMGAFYRRMRAKHGPTKANLAAAHKLSRIIYFMMLNKSEYKDPGADYYQEKYRKRIINNLKKKAAALGYELKSVAA